ncbi:restriction endonuclease subunit S [Staphylococcus epidermidis]|nr:restriction endonuclease subunit S [Staphylococcus epidermidis]MCG2424327.1 restriction endonuclease subunit S [Staphylococcus epidermidis]
MTNEIKNIPQLRFPNFDGDWEECKLEEISDKVTEKNKNNQFSETLTNSAEYGVISQRDFFDKDISNEKNLNGYYIVQEDDFVYNPRISNFAPVGPIKRNKLGRTGVMSPLYYVFRTRNIDVVFLDYYFETTGWHKFMKLNGDSGARADRFAIKDLIFKTMPIPYPIIEEQEKIGNFFSKLDRQIELEEEKLELLEQQKKGYMQKIFSQEVRFKDDNGNSYPEWESAPLFDIFSATKGKSLSKDKISDDGKYECILYGEIYTTYAEKIESIVSRTNYYEGILSQKNDLIFPNSTTTNAWDLAIFSSLQKNNVLIGGDISILRTKRSDISSLFYAYYLTNYLKLRKDIAKYAQGITIVHLSFNNFCKIKVQIPSLEEQNSITDFIDSLNQQQKLITNKIKLLKERKKGFLQKMFV